ncbi:MAG: hypothetical protein RBR42_13030 [Desulfomicrobium sp.]|nr:hypothetical protein [Desulfomicrobium sp.]
MKRIIDIQTVTLEHTDRGVTQEWVYNNIVFPTYRISRSCYYAYLGTNAKAELKRLDENASKQLNLF